jgi:hypothetical protein
MMLPCLINLAQTAIHEQEPWVFKANPHSTSNPNAYKTWRKQIDTEHLFYSGIVGQASNLRVSEENPPCEIRAIIADYDSVISDTVFDEGLKLTEKYYEPTYVHRTPLSGGVRLIWMLERPLLLPNYDVSKRFLKACLKYTHAKEVFANLDEPAFENPNLYYDVGHSWQSGGGLPIPWVDACGWLLKVSEKAKWSGDVIPMEILSAEVEKKFPGRWQGDFYDGARGCRFWDAEADNPTAAIVRPTGMQCFTGTESFVPWASILGRGFVEKLSSRKLGELLDGIYYDGDAYWYRTPSGKWESHAEREMARHLKVNKGLSADRIESKTYSEIDEALDSICQNHRISGVAPFIFQPSGVLNFMGEQILNISNVKVINPPEDYEKIIVWGTNFPWIGKFLQDLFDPNYTFRL